MHSTADKWWSFRGMNLDKTTDQNLTPCKRFNLRSNTCIWMRVFNDTTHEFQIMFLSVQKIQIASGTITKILFYKRSSVDISTPTFFLHFNDKLQCQQFRLDAKSALWLIDSLIDLVPSPPSPASWVSWLERRLYLTPPPPPVAECPVIHPCSSLCKPKLWRLLVPTRCALFLHQGLLGPPLFLIPESLLMSIGANATSGFWFGSVRRIRRTCAGHLQRVCRTCVLIFSIPALLRISSLGMRMGQ